MNHTTLALLESLSARIQKAYLRAAAGGPDPPVLFVLDLRAGCARDLAAALGPGAEVERHVPPGREGPDEAVLVCCVSFRRALDVVTDEQVRAPLRGARPPGRYPVIVCCPDGVDCSSWSCSVAELEVGLTRWLERYGSDPVAFYLGYAALALYLVAFWLPVEKGTSGFGAFAVAFLALKDWAPVWLANVAFWVGLVLVHVRRGGLFVSAAAVLALLLGLLPLVRGAWSGGFLDAVRAVQSGYWCWLAGLAVLGVAGIFKVFREPKRLPEVPEPAAPTPGEQAAGAPESPDAEGDLAPVPEDFKAAAGP
jgi:hypothetical protein